MSPPGRPTGESRTRAAEGHTTTALGKVARGTLAAAVLAILLLTYACPLVVPESRSAQWYEIAAVAAMWGFLAAVAALVWSKACRAPRT